MFQSGILTNGMKKGVSKLGEACMKSVGATIEEVNTLKKGPPFQKKASCVLACIFDKVLVTYLQGTMLTSILAAHLCN